jgi:WhiB family redox-sensing transcriptional regulator
VTLEAQEAVPVVRISTTRRRGEGPRPIVEDWDWQSRGHCLRWPTEVFFPEDQGRQGLRARQQRAKQICRNCPVLDDCREHALRAPEVQGIWGATTPRERAHLLDG